MNPSDVIDSYVVDVLRRLPHRQRRDVGLELRSLLGEELEAKAREAGRPADEAMALALLNGFGRPEEVAERYGPTGFMIIKPAAAPGFTWAALIGVAVQWALSLPAALMHPQSHVGTAGSFGDVAAQFGRWWVSWGVGAFWFPGFMVVVAIIAAWIGRRWPDTGAWAPRRVLDRDRVNRPLLAFALAAWAAYMALLATEPLLLGALPEPVAAAFTFDDDFLRSRGPWLYPVWIGQFLVCATALVEGRWRRRTRQLNDVFGAAVCGVLAWFVVAGPIFESEAADGLTKLAICFVILISLIGLGITLYGQQGLTGLPKGLPAPPRR